MSRRFTKVLPRNKKYLGTENSAAHTGRRWKVAGTITHKLHTYISYTDVHIMMIMNTSCTDDVSTGQFAYGLLARE